MKRIKTIHARQILDSRGNPTIEVDVVHNQLLRIEEELGSEARYVGKAPFKIEVK